MDPSVVNRNAQIIEIEDDVIDLDGAEKTPEEVIYEWDATIRKKLSMFTVADNENILVDLMNEYLQSLQEIIRIYEDNVSLKNKVFCHINFLYSYYGELQCCSPDNYLIKMEDILTLYCNLELEVVCSWKRKDFTKAEYRKKKLSVSKQIIRMLTVYLLERHDHILHVLIKMNTANALNTCSELLNTLYMHYLTRVRAFNVSDESFCRSYIMYQKWKEIRPETDWKGMDEIMYKIFKRTPDSVKNSETLRQILMPASQSPVGIVLNLFRSVQDISNAYFKHIIAQRNTEMDDLDFHIDLADDELTPPKQNENDEEVEFLKAYFEVDRNMSNLPLNTNESTLLPDLATQCKQEVNEDDDDDVLFIGILSPPPQNTETFILNDNDDSIHTNNNELAIEEETLSIPVSPPPALTLKEISADLENLNGITKILSTMEESTTTTTTLPVDDQQENHLFAIASVFGNVPEIASESANEPEVPLQVPSPLALPVMEEAGPKLKDAQVQAHLYNDYGLTTPPFDLPSDEQSAVYLEKLDSDQNLVTRTVEVQVDMPSECYNDYGLTPPNEDTPIDDHNSRVETTCLYTNIGTTHKEKSGEEHVCEPPPPPTDNGPTESLQEDTTCQSSNHDCDILPNTKKKVEEHLDPPHVAESETVVDEPTSEELNDTGQEVIPDTAPSIEEISPLLITTDEAKDCETFNGASVLKPLVTSNRTNGQTKKDVTTSNSPTKIMYTSTQKIKASLDEFSRFENTIQLEWSKMKENQDLEKILSGPVTKITPTKHNNFSPQDRLDIFSQEAKPQSSSRSNSPTEMTSPAYEGIDDFRNYYSDRVNGRVPPPHDIRVPQGILKKADSVRKKNCRIMFHESTCDNSEERRRRSDGVLVPKRVRRDKKLNMEPRVVVERLSFIENKMKKILNNPPTLRVDYDKTTRHINEKDVVRCISPPRFSWLIKSCDFSRTRKHTAGSLTVKNREHLEKKPKKRKFEPPSNSVEEPAITKKRAFRTAKKKPLGLKGSPRKRQSSPCTTENSYVSKSDSDIDKLLNSGLYSNKPFRLDLTS